MNSEKKITVREGGWDDFWILRDGIGEEQHIHAMNRPDIFADLEESPFGPEDFRLIMEDENSFFLVAEVDGTVQGYAYAGAFVGRAAYDWSCELTIYLARDARKMGLGRQLYTALEQRLAQMGVLNLYACIGWPEAEDEYLTCNSAQFHEHLGFTLAGTFRRCGYKFGRWYDMVWMEKLLAPHRPQQPAIIPYPDLPHGENV